MCIMEVQKKMRQSHAALMKDPALGLLNVLRVRVDAEGAPTGDAFDSAQSPHLLWGWACARRIAIVMLLAFSLQREGSQLAFLRSGESGRGGGGGERQGRAMSATSLTIRYRGWTKRTVPPGGGGGGEGELTPSMPVTSPAIQRRPNTAAGMGRIPYSRTVWEGKRQICAITTELMAPLAPRAAELARLRLSSPYLSILLPPRGIPACIKVSLESLHHSQLPCILTAGSLELARAFNLNGHCRQSVMDQGSCLEKMQSVNLILLVMQSLLHASLTAAEHAFVSVSENMHQQMWKHRKDSIPT